MLVKNIEVQRLLMHYEFLLWKFQEVRELVDAAGWSGTDDVLALEPALKGLIRLARSGKESF